MVRALSPPLLLLVLLVSALSPGDAPAVEPAQADPRASLTPSTPLTPLTPLTLREVLSRIREEGAAGRAARERTAAAEAASRQARRWLNPSLELRAENMRPFSPGPLVPWDSADLFATLSQTFEVGGKRSARVAGALATGDATRAEARGASRDALLDGARAYLAVVRGREGAAYLGENRAALEEVARRTRLKVAEGWTAEADLRRFEAEAARAADQETRARAEAVRSAALLSALTGEPVEGLSARVAVPAPVPLPDGDPSALAKAALEKSPEVAAARARLARAREAVRLEKARRLPDPDLTLGYKRTGGLDTAVAGVVLPLPVWDANAGNVARASAEERAAAIEAAQAERRALSETASLVATARDLASAASRAERSVVAPAGEVRRASQAAFAEGAADVLKLLDAERVWLDARREALDLRLEAAFRSLEALFALGQEEIP